MKLPPLPRAVRGLDARPPGEDNLPRPGQADLPSALGLIRGPFAQRLYSYESQGTMQKAYAQKQS